MVPRRKKVGNRVVKNRVESRVQLLRAIVVVAFRFGICNAFNTLYNLPSLPPTVRVRRILEIIFVFSRWNVPRAHRPRERTDSKQFSSRLIHPLCVRIVLSPDASLLWETDWRGGVDSFLFRAFWFWIRPGDGKNFSNVFTNALSEY